MAVSRQIANFAARFGRKVTAKSPFMQTALRQKPAPAAEKQQSTMDEQLSKRFYRIGDVAEILNIPASTLRYWEKEFTIIKPQRNAKNVRLYTPKDIETIRMIYFLVKEKGLKLDAAQAMIRRNRDGVSKQFEVIERLKGIRAKLLDLNRALSAVKS